MCMAEAYVPMVHYNGHLTVATFGKKAYGNLSVTFPLHA